MLSTEMSLVSNLQTLLDFQCCQFFVDFDRRSNQLKDFLIPLQNFDLFTEEMYFVNNSKAIHKPG